MLLSLLHLHLLLEEGFLWLTRVKFTCLPFSLSSSPSSPPLPLLSFHLSWLPPPPSHSSKRPSLCLRSHKVSTQSLHRPFSLILTVSNCPAETSSSSETSPHQILIHLPSQDICSLPWCGHITRTLFTDSTVFNHKTAKSTIPLDCAFPSLSPGLPCWLSWERIRLQCGRPGIDPWVGEVPWRRERLPTLVFWPGEFHGLYSPWGWKSQTQLSDFHFLVTEPLSSLALKLLENRFFPTSSPTLLVPCSGSARCHWPLLPHRTLSLGVTYDPSLLHSWKS